LRRRTLEKTWEKGIKEKESRKVSGYGSHEIFWGKIKKYALEGRQRIERRRTTLYTRLAEVKKVRGSRCTRQEKEGAESGVAVPSGPKN